MHRVIPYLFLLICSFARSQRIKKSDVILSGLQFIAGASDGIREQVLYHPNELFLQHPNLNRQWWDSRISWQNKYSQPWYLVSISDANHCFKAGTFYSDMISICLSAGDLNVWTIVKKLVITFISRKAGFHSTYHLYFKNK